MGLARVVRYAEQECSRDNVPLTETEGTSAGVACAWDPAQPSRGTCRPQEHQLDERNISNVIRLKNISQVGTSRIQEVDDKTSGIGLNIDK